VLDLVEGLCVPVATRRAAPQGVSQSSGLGTSSIPKAMASINITIVPINYAAVGMEAYFHSTIKAAFPLPSPPRITPTDALGHGLEE
jgi:hypothetical protein